MTSVSESLVLHQDGSKNARSTCSTTLISVCARRSTALLRVERQPTLLQQQSIGAAFGRSLEVSFQFRFKLGHRIRWLDQTTCAEASTKCVKTPHRGMSLCISNPTRAKVKSADLPNPSSHDHDAGLSAPRSPHRHPNPQIMRASLSSSFLAP